MTLKLLRCLAAALTLLAGSHASLHAAGDAALYGPAAPPGSAFIRVFNTASDDINVRIGDETLAGVAPHAASEFVFVPAGTHTLDSGAAQRPALTLAADRYYTAVVGSDGAVRLLDNARYANKLKALVMVYNLTSAPALGLRTPDGATAVVADVAPHQSGTREVNPARAQLAVFDGGGKLADAPPMSFARGKAYSLFVVGDAAQPRLVWAVN